MSTPRVPLFWIFFGAAVGSVRMGVGVQARAQPDRAAAAGPGCRHLAWQIIVDVAEKITQRLIIGAA
jgi:hypothetical protein